MATLAEGKAFEPAVDAEPISSVVSSEESADVASRSFSLEEVRSKTPFPAKEMPGLRADGICFKPLFAQADELAEKEGVPMPLLLRTVEKLEEHLWMCEASLLEEQSEQRSQGAVEGSGWLCRPMISSSLSSPKGFSIQGRFWCASNQDRDSLIARKWRLREWRSVTAERCDDVCNLPTAFWVLSRAVFGGSWLPPSLPSSAAPPAGTEFSLFLSLGAFVQCERLTKECNKVARLHSEAEVSVCRISLPSERGAAWALLAKILCASEFCCRPW